MNMNRHTYMSLFFFISIASCSTDKEYKDMTEFSWENFTDVKDLKSKVFLSEDIVYRPTELQVYENYLVIKDYGGENGCFRIFDIKTKELLGERIPKGKGPLEMLSPRFAQSSKDNIVIWDTQKFILHKYLIHDFITNNSPTPIEIIDLNKELCINVGTTEKGIFGQIYDKEFQLCKYDTSTTHGTKFAEFPSFTYDDYNEVIKRDAYYMNFTSNNTSKIAICYSMTDLIDLYDMNGNFIKRLHGPERFYPHFKMVKSNQIEGAFPMADKCKDAYFVPKNYGNHFTVMYNGRGLNEENHTSSSDKILSFSWEGTPLTCYKLDKQIVSYDFDEKNKKIYAITVDPEYKIIQYDYP